HVAPNLIVERNGKSVFARQRGPSQLPRSQCFVRSTSHYEIAMRRVRLSRCFVFVLRTRCVELGARYPEGRATYLGRGATLGCAGKPDHRRSDYASVRHRGLQFIGIGKWFGCLEVVEVMPHRNVISIVDIAVHGMSAGAQFDPGRLESIVAFAPAV